MLRFSTVAVRPQKRQAMVRQASRNGRSAGTWPRSRRRLRVRAVVGAKQGLLLRLRVRLSGVLALLLRGVEELGCRPSGAATRGSSAPRARGPTHCCQARRFGSDQSSFYEEAIADCLEFIKSRSSYLESN